MRSLEVAALTYAVCNLREAQCRVQHTEELLNVSVNK